MTTESVPRWRRLEPDERRSAILSAAVRAFGEKPYDSVQMAAIARDAGVARGLLHHYFGTKRDLFLEVVRSMMFVPPLEDVDLPDGELRDRVEASVDWLMALLAAHGRTWLVVGVGGAGTDAELRAILDQADEQAAERVLEGIGYAGGVRDRVVALATIKSFGGMVRAAVREWLDHGSFTQEQVRELLVETLNALVVRIVNK